MIRIVTQTFIEKQLKKAELSVRKRALFRLHEHHEPVQRMINAILPESYIRPHKHEDPDKVELFSILKGKIACLHFQPDGEIQQLYILEENGVNQIADIAPRTYHTLLALEPSVVLEIIQGPYEAETHKQFAPWSPEEGSTKAQDYLMYLRALVENWR